MRVDGVDAQVQGRGDFLVGLAFGDQLQHFALAAGQQVDGIGDMLPVVRKHRVGDAGTQIALSAGNRPHRRDQILVHGVFQKVAARAGPQYFADVDGILVHAQREDAGPRSGFAHAPGRLNAVEFGHRDVHHNHIRREFGRGFQSLAAIGSLADNLHVGLRFENAAESLPHHAMVVGQDNADFAHASSRSR